jgi:hypothetical protein
MELSNPLPPYMSVGILRAKFYYQGIMERCFYCNGTDHVKMNCPKKNTPVSHAHQRMQRQNGMHSVEHQQQQQPRQPQQPLEFFSARKSIRNISNERNRSWFLSSSIFFLISSRYRRKR